jgi:hypothetical protein
MVDGLKWLLFPLAHFSYDMKRTISTKWLAIPNRGHSHFPQNFGTSYEYLNHHQNGDSCAL